MIVQYLREEDGTRKPFGCLVATGKDQVGVSLCNPKDKWNKTKARMIAQARAEKGILVKVPNNVHGDIALEEFAHFVDRANRYFQG